MKTGECRAYLQGLGIPDEAIVEQVVQAQSEAGEASSS